MDSYKRTNSEEESPRILTRKWMMKKKVRKVSYKKDMVGKRVGNDSHNKIESAEKIEEMEFHRKANSCNKNGDLRWAMEI